MHTGISTHDDPRHLGESATRPIEPRCGALAVLLLLAGKSPPGLERMRQAIIDQPPPAARHVRPTANDLRAALGVFLLVFASTFPVVLPFIFIANLQLAMRVSAAIALAMLFLCGYGWGRYRGISP